MVLGGRCRLFVAQPSLASITPDYEKRREASGARARRRERRSTCRRVVEAGRYARPGGTELLAVVSWQAALPTRFTACGCVAPPSLTYPRPTCGAVNGRHRDVVDALFGSAIPVLGAQISQRVIFAESAAQGSAVLKLDAEARPGGRSKPLRMKSSLCAHSICEDAIACIRSYNRGPQAGERR